MSTESFLEWWEKLDDIEREEYDRYMKECGDEEAEAEGED